MSSFANRLPVRRIDFTDDESCRPVRIVSIRQHSMPLFNALGRKKVHFNIDNILTMDLRPFHALRTWKVYVVIFSFHTTHFQTLLTPLTSGMLTHDWTSGIPCYSFSHIACHPPLPVCWRTIRLPVCWFVSDHRRIVAVWIYWTCMLRPFKHKLHFEHHTFGLRQAVRLIEHEVPTTEYSFARFYYRCVLMGCHQCISLTSWIIMTNMLKLLFNLLW